MPPSDLERQDRWVARHDLINGPEIVFDAMVPHAFAGAGQRVVLEGAYRGGP